MKYSLVVSSLLACAITTAAVAEPVKPAVTELGVVPHNMLVVGNSYMYYNCGIQNYLNGLIEEGLKQKYRSRIATLAHGNLSQYPVEELMDNTKMASHDPKKGTLSDDLLQKEIAKREKYEIVMLQASNGGLDEQKRDAHYVKIHAQAIRDNGSIPVLVDVWVDKKGKAPPQEQVTEEVTKIANDNNMMVIPVGSAFAAAEKAHPDWKLIMVDNTHPTAAGSYLMGAVMYGAIYHKDPLEPSKVFPGRCDKPLPQEQREELAKIAWDTVRSFYGWKE